MVRSFKSQDEIKSDETEHLKREKIECILTNQRRGRQIQGENREKQGRLLTDMAKREYEEKLERRGLSTFKGPARHPKTGNKTKVLY